MARTYTPEEREAILGFASEHGPADAAKQFGVARSTVHTMMRLAGLPVPDAPPQTRAATAASLHKRELARAKLDVTLLTKAQRVLNRIDQPHVEYRGVDRAGKPVKVLLGKPSASAVRDYAVAAGILIDKYRLEMGEATTRAESRDITNDDHEREALRDAIKRELALRHAESARRADQPPAAPGADEAAVAADAPAGTGAA